MKSEKQQVQESNLIADKIESFLVKTKRSLPAILAVIAFALIALIGFGIFKSFSYSQASKGWAALYFSDTDAADLASIADDFRSTSAGFWARQAAGDSHLAKAVESVFVNRDVADGHYKNALVEYEQIVSKASESFLLSRAFYGLAQTYEGLANKEEAIKNYREISSLKGIDSEFQLLATKRADWLESKEGDMFFTWYAANRSAAPTIVPSTGERPALPSAPTIDFSSLPAPSNADPTPEVQTSESPASEGESSSNSSK